MKDDYQRADEEILERIEETGSSYFYADYLPYETAKTILDSESLKDWEGKKKDRKSIKAEMLGHMNYAWRKANGFRGISASCAIENYKVWVWLAGDDLGDFDEEYEYYGKDILVKICNHYGWNSSQWDDGVRLNEEPWW